MKTVVTPEKEKYIRQNYLKKPSRDLAADLNISKTAILKFLKRSGLEVPAQVVTDWRKRKAVPRPFTDEENQYIIDNIETLSTKVIALKLKRCKSKVRHQAKKLGLEHILIRKSIESRIKPGTTPPKKGKKLEEFMKPDTLAKFKANMFKKGNIPHNALPEGSETYRKDSKGNIYTLIKLPGARKLKYKHVYLWEKHNGNVPKGFNVVFKDCNTQNCVIENLECISNEELMQRNTVHNYPPELKELMYIKARITREINKNK